MNDQAQIICFYQNYANNQFNEGFSFKISIELRVICSSKRTYLFIEKKYERQSRFHQLQNYVLLLHDGELLLLFWMKITYLLVLIALTAALANAYNAKIAKELAAMSSIAYDTVATINAWSCNLCKANPLINVKAFSNSVGDLQGFTGFSSNLNGIVLAFRGSSNTQNWIINLSTNQVAYSKCTGCKVHNGFYTAWGLAKPLVNPEIQRLRSLHRDAHIYITGHSLGGAIATLSAPDIKETYGGISALYTFGEPRVGNQQFADYYPSVIANERVVHYADIVPHIPPENFGFKHQGQEVWYDKAMKTFKTCQGETPNCSNSLPVTSFNTGDHSMDTYLTLPATPMERAMKEVEGMIQKASELFLNLASVPNLAKYQEIETE